MPGRKPNTYAGEKTILITQVRSAIANKPKTVGTLRALGLGKIGQTSRCPTAPRSAACLPGFRTSSR